MRKRREAGSGMAAVAFKPGSAEALGGLVARRPAVCDGAVRWYLARAGEGREAALAADLRALLAPGTLADAFCPRWEMLAKRRGEWLVLERAMFPGYAVLASPDAPALSRALSRLSFAVPMAGRRGRDLSPVEAGVQEWLQGALDGRHVLRASEGAIRAGGLSVERGPLKGSEGRVRRIDRHKSMAWVALGDAEPQFLLRAALAVPVRE